MGIKEGHSLVAEKATFTPTSVHNLGHLGCIQNQTSCAWPPRAADLQYNRVLEYLSRYGIR